MVSILAIGVYLPVTAPRAHAVIPTVETNPVMLGNILATSLASADQLLISKVLKGLAWAVAKTAIQTMTKSIVNWINGGFEGSPAFETDLNNSLRRYGDGVAQGFLSQMANEAAIQSPFSDQLITNVGAAYYLYSGREGTKEKLRYTLNQSAADDRAFLAGDFSQGGWNAWLSAFQNPANNPFGAQMIASQELARTVSTAANQRVAELGWGSGFLSWKGDCVKSGKNTVASTGGSSTAGTASGTSLANKAGSASKSSGGSTAVTAAGATNAQSLSDSEKCPESEIKTPGSVIEGTLIPNLNSPLHQLELADDINEIVGALAQQLVSKVIGGGGLSGVSQPSQGGGRSALSQASDPSQYTQSVTNLSGGFNQGVDTSRAQAQTYRDSWQKIATAATEAKRVCSSHATEAQTVLDRATRAIARADAAIQALDAIKEQTGTVDPSIDGGAGRLVDITNGYLNLLSNGTLPSAAEITEASTESQDTGDDKPGSLYSQMNRLSNPLLCVRSGN